ncbi:unnamed protein product [Didymodactylos carnosus]|uniref:Uncharacterized protein n=1 Tax=Didymodactylos carnosus TaxID=1234261 RepID=A0A8S2FUE5_9BILA|nr:unnamed protein product [Didymodactylos carnosus]CAF4352893.1 unnamed protein product [Didymodactylos carnosus]
MNNQTLQHTITDTNDEIKQLRQKIMDLEQESRTKVTYEVTSDSNSLRSEIQDKEHEINALKRKLDDNASEITRLRQTTVYRAEPARVQGKNTMPIIRHSSKDFFSSYLYIIG